MTRLYIIALITFFGFDVHAQYTSGGNKKQYDKVVKTEYDTIWEEHKKDPPMPKVGQDITFELVMPNSNFKSEMDYNTWIQHSESAAGISTGQMGGSNGFAIGYGIYAPLNSINKNLITNIDIGLDFKADYMFVPFSLNYVSDYWTTVNGGSSWLTNITDEISGKYNVIGFGIGPRVTVNPLGFENKLRIDIGLKIQPSWILFPDFNDYDYTSSTSQNYDYYLTNYIDYSSSTIFSLGLRYGAIQIGLSKQFGLKDDGIYSEEIQLYDFPSSSTQYINNEITSKVSLANTRLFLGFHF